MAIIRVGKVQLFNERLMPGDQGIGHGLVHQFHRALKCTFQIRAFFDNAAGPFAVDLFRPACPEESC